MSKSDIEPGATEVCVSNCSQEESHNETTAVPQHSGEVLDGVYSGWGERLRLQSRAKCSKAVMIFERGSQAKNQYLLQPCTSQVLPDLVHRALLSPVVCMMYVENMRHPLPSLTSQQAALCELVNTLALFPRSNRMLAG